MEISRVETFTHIGGAFISSAYFGGTYYLGNYGSRLVSGPPWTYLTNLNCESIYDMAVWNSNLWMCVEGPTPDRGGLYKVVGGVPTPILLDSYGFSFALEPTGTALFYNRGSTEFLMLSKILLSDESVVDTCQIFPDNWLSPATPITEGQKGLLFLLGAPGGAGDWNSSLVLMSNDGYAFTPVVGMQGLSPIAKVALFKGNYYFGTWPTLAEWTTCTTAKVYKTDIVGNVTLSLQTGSNRISTFFQFGGELYVLATAGWNYNSSWPTTPNSYLYKTTDGDTWTLEHTFVGDPEINTAVVSDDGTGLVLGGGHLGDQWSSVYANEGVYVTKTGGISITGYTT